MTNLCTQPRTCPKAHFTECIGRSPDYITWFNENGRRVLSLNGKQIDVLATEAVICDTAAAAEIHQH